MVTHTPISARTRKKKQKKTKKNKENTNIWMKKAIKDDEICQTEFP